MNKIKVILKSLLLLLFPVILSCSKISSNDSNPLKDKESVIADYSVEILKVLDKRADMVEKMLLDPLISSSVKKENLDKEYISKKDILKLDKEWRSSLEDNRLSKNILNSACSKFLTAFKSTFNFDEVFITGAIGLNVCMSNKTTDYYQADEIWWQNAYKNGTGEKYYGLIEYDESSFSEAISIYIPLFDSNRNVTGICKAVLSLNRIKMEI